MQDGVATLEISYDASERGQASSATVAVSWRAMHDHLDQNSAEGGFFFVAEQGLISNCIASGLFWLKGARDRDYATQETISC